jgi:hypothetical protein
MEGEKEVMITRKEGRRKNNDTRAKKEGYVWR